MKKVEILALSSEWKKLPNNDARLKPFQHKCGGILKLPVFALDDEHERARLRKKQCPKCGASFSRCIRSDKEINKDLMKQEQEQEEEEKNDRRS